MFKRRNVVLLLAVLAFVAGLATGRPIIFNITYLLGILLIISFAWAWANINWLHLSRVTRTRRTQVGRPLEERFVVRNTSRIPKLWLQVRDFSTVPAHFASQVVNGLGPRASYAWRTVTICQQRGRYQLGPLLLSTSDPFGLFPMQRRLEATSNVVVFPLTVDVHQFALPAGILPGGDALRRRTHYITTNAAGVRDYAPGDSFNRIHWKSTARRNRLIVKEFELDPLADIWIVPDMAAAVQYAAPGATTPAPPANLLDGSFWKRSPEETRPAIPQATEEYVVTIAASLAQYFLRLDRSVGMLAYGQSHEVVQPDRGERQLNRLLETLAVLRAQGNIPLRDVLHAESGLLPRGTTVIAVTPTTNPVWAGAARELQRRGSRAVSILVNPESFGGPESNLPLMDMLRMNRIVTYLVNYQDDLTAALSQRRMAV